MDGLRKERDTDNDNGGSLDGCEDANQNGKVEPALGETSNFDSNYEKPCNINNNEMIYILPDELAVPKSKHSIESVVLSVKHNGMQIILKTGIGGAPLISRMLDSMGESAGILGTLAGDDTIFIAPVEVVRIEEIAQSIRALLGVKVSQ